MIVENHGLKRAQTMPTGNFDVVDGVVRSRKKEDLKRSITDKYIGGKNITGQSPGLKISRRKQVTQSFLQHSLRTIWPEFWINSGSNLTEKTLCREILCISIFCTALLNGSSTLNQFELNIESEKNCC
jgi:hypothetical protein